jgi:RNA polymerase sigma-70 factor (ECF subfamily)
LENIKHVIRGCIEKEHHFQKMLYEHYHGFALKIVFRYIYHYEKAVDIATDGFIKLFNHFEQFVFSENENDESCEKHFMGYLKKVMVNTAIDELRKVKMTPEIGGIPDHVWQLTDKANDADQLLLYKDLIILTKELPPQYRTVFNLYVIDGYNHIEIAGLLKIPIGTSKSNLHKARLILKEVIKKIEEAKVCSV